MTAETTEPSIQGSIDAGIMWKADTLEDLAEKAGFPKDEFVKTVARYNELCAKGVDEDFGKDPKWLAATTIDSPPYYAGYWDVAHFVLPFGLNVNLHSQVCDAKGDAIEGLFAIGNVQGNFFAHDYPLLTPGISHGRCITFGRLVGKALAHGELI